MKKTTLLIAIVTACAVSVVLAEPRKVHLRIAAVPTNAAATVTAATTTNGTTTIGYFKGIYLDFSGYASPTCNVDVVALGSIGTTERTLFSADDLIADKEYFPRDIADTTAGVEIANTPVVIPLMSDRLILRAYAANVTNTITLNTYIYVDDIP